MTQDLCTRGAMMVELGDYEVFSEERQGYTLGGLKYRGMIVFHPVPPQDATQVQSIWHVSKFLGQLCLVEEMTVQEGEQE